MFSIIVPVYNAERYLEECINSIITQDYNAWELILINDGSRDNSLQICMDYAELDNRIIVINKENSGVSDTRNLGIEMAEGKYILFVDADDFLKPGTLKKIEKSIIQNNQPNMVVWGFEILGGKNTNDDFDLLMNTKNGFTSEQLLHHLVSIDHKKRFRGMVWRAIFKKSLLQENEIRFSVGLKMSEDFKFILEAISLAEYINVLPERLYVYRINPESTTAKYKENVHPDMMYINDWMEREICPQYPTLHVGLSCCRAETYITMLQNLCLPNTPFNLKERIGVAKRVRRKYSYSKHIHTANMQLSILSLKRIIVYTMLTLHMEFLYIFLFSLKKKTVFRKTYNL